MAKPYYLGIVSNQDVVKAKGYSDPATWSMNTHMDHWPFDTHDLSRHWRISKGAIQFDDSPSMDVFFKTMDWADSEGVKLTTIQLGWHGRLQPLSSFDPRQLREKHMPKVSRKSLTLQEVKLPLAEIGLTGPTRMEVQRRYNVHRSTGLTVQGAIRRVEMELGIRDLTVNASGKDVVFFKNPDDSFTIHETKAEDDLVSKFLGMQIDRCPSCNGLLAHRKGVALPCPTCKPKAVRVDEVWKSMTSVADWTGANPGYDFRIILLTPTGSQIVDRTPNLKVARQLAKEHHRRTKRRVEVLDAKGRRYFSLGN